MQPEPTPTPPPVAADQFQQTLVQNYTDLTHWIQSTADKAGSFLTEQTPLFIQEYLAWVFWGSVLSLIIYIVGFAVSSMTALSFLKKSLKAEIEEDSPTFFYSMPIVLASVVLAFCFFMALVFDGINAARTIVKVTVAPRVVLVEKIKELTR